MKTLPLPPRYRSIPWCFALLIPTALAGEPTLRAQSQMLPGPTRWAIVAGVSRYDDPTLAKCPGADDSARRVADWLTETAGWRADRIMTLTGAGRMPPSKADGPVPPGGLALTKANLEGTVSEWYVLRARPGDMLLIYFAGRAAVTTDVTGEAGRAAGLRLLPVDARLDETDGTALDLED